MFKIINIKNTIIHLRKCIKVVIIVAISTFLITGIVLTCYKPIYSVTLNGEMIGYSQNKNELQQKINAYIEKGNGSNVAFVDIKELPQYKLCLLKKHITANDDEIFEKVISGGTQYYKYYGITVDSEEKLYVASFEEAEEVINKLKEKNSNNKDKLGVKEKYNTELVEFTTVEQSIDKLYVKKVVQKPVSNVTIASTGVNTSNKVVNLGISLIRPVSGVLTSRFGARWGKSHKGIDIGAPKGTTIVAAASGTVTLSQYGYGGGYGNHIIISHGNGVQTLYGHCTSLLVNKGAYVTQGQAIATVGNTGNSQGNHLHLEIRVNGVAQNPQNYLY